MAAYDSGPLTVQRAIERTGYADYWELRKLHALPAETENYVPVFLATALIAKDPKTYGFDTPPDPPLAVDKVEVDTPTDLAPDCPNYRSPRGRAGAAQPQLAALDDARQ